MSDKTEVTIVATEIEERDAGGRFLPGHKRIGKAGQPTVQDAGRMTTAVLAVMDEKTTKAWIEAMQRKMRRGDIRASQFIFDRILGRPESIEQTRSGGPIQINVVWGGNSGGRFDVIDGEATAISDRSTTDAPSETEGVYRIAGETEGDPGG